MKGMETMTHYFYIDPDKVIEHGKTFPPSAVDGEGTQDILMKAAAQIKALAEQLDKLKKTAKELDREATEHRKENRALRKCLKGML